jgi:hypothetical protein
VALEDQEVLGVVGVVDDGGAFLSARFSAPFPGPSNLLNRTDASDADAPRTAEPARPSRVMDPPAGRLKVTNTQIRSDTATYCR